MKKLIILISLVLCVVFIMSSCDEIKKYIYNPFDPVTETETETETDAGLVTIEEDTVIPHAEFVDPITGDPTETDISTARPVAVVVKNDRTASPQFGLSGASVLYEASVEGGLTRFLAVYSDVSQVNKVGPVIDSRSYFYDFAANHNAVFVQAGTTSNGNKTQISRGITALDAIVGDMTPGFYRDQALISSRGTENSILTDANGLKSRASQYGISLKTDRQVKPYTTVDYLQNRSMTGGTYCTFLSIPFSTNMTVEYKYSTLTNKYSRSQYGEIHTDALNGKQLSFTNLIIIIADYNTANMTTGEMNIVNTGKGSGYYIYGGSSIMITWQRTDGENPIKLYEADGLTPLQISSGNTYVAVVSPRLSGKIEFERSEK